MANNHGEYISPLRIGLWDPFQMAFFCFINEDDPPSIFARKVTKLELTRAVGAGMGFQR